MLGAFEVDDVIEDVYILTLENGQEVEFCIHGDKRYLLTEFFSFLLPKEFSFVLQPHQTELVISNEDGDVLILSKNDCEIFSKIF
jgi:hypothetical protein